MEVNGHNLEIISRYFGELTETQQSQIDQLGGLYSAWNDKINVISRKDIEHLYQRHVLHSLAIAAVFDFAPGMQVVDIGTGGGFPAIPLAIFFPETVFTAVDSIGKKLKVVEEIGAATGLKNIKTRHMRVEEISGTRFDVAVTRAVAPLQKLLEWTRNNLARSKETLEKFSNHPVNKNARLASGLIALKGGDLALEIQQSNKNPLVWEIEELFPETFFREKYVLQILT